MRIRTEVNSIVAELSEEGGIGWACLEDEEVETPLKAAGPGKRKSGRPKGIVS
jgi:hypothetical protein